MRLMFTQTVLAIDFRPVPFSRRRNIPPAGLAWEGFGLGGVILRPPIRVTGHGPLRRLSVEQDSVRSVH
jgi:hypothetical protein